ncbi:hypothetical protein [Desulfosporosinus fructosivorans]
MACGVKAKDGMEIKAVLAEVFNRKVAVLLNMFKVDLDHGLKKVLKNYSALTRVVLLVSN